jgi:two-component sensor histidine kinase
MPDLVAENQKLIRQQAAIAAFGSFALRQDDLHKVLTEAARVCADGLSVPFCKICRYRQFENDLLIEAGFGWKQGVIGHIVSRADESSPQGRAFITGKPSICNDLRVDTGFQLPAFYAEHGIVSTIDVLIKGDGQSYGVLEIDNNHQHDYGDNDVNFLTGFANVLAEAVATATRTTLLRAMIEEKDRLLEQKNTLAQELQHRVRNNMQLVYGMLSRQLDDTADLVGQRGLRSIARRVSTLAQVYDHLLGNEMTRTTDFGAYVQSLCMNIVEIHAKDITLHCDCDPVLLDLDTVTALGIVLAELVTNSYDHAFVDGTGTINVSIRAAIGNEVMARLVVSDTGSGFIPNIGSKRHGLGLVKRLVEQIGGTIRVTSDQGTMWDIRFPAPVPASEALVPAA